MSWSSHYLPGSTIQPTCRIAAPIFATGHATTDKRESPATYLKINGQIIPVHMTSGKSHEIEAYRCSCGSGVDTPHTVDYSS